MKTARKLICILVASTTLGAVAPVFADSRHERYRDRDYDRHGYYDRNHYRPHIRDIERRRVVVVERPYVVERQVPVYYPEPAPSIGLGAMIGAIIGGIYDSRQ
ncbi:MAG: hypothetical protein A3H35_08630 [Betaproteobacteria bacterium RIFCSPLOWO2_02_FULL_62_17]|nr:MAG: hypothetical protein A3H35_08630 [Betaproteobacteria bacterium RIFCSPLOWO2_02_FULL_62_17]